MFFFYQQGMLSFSNVEAIRDFIQSFGVFAPMMFICLFALAPLVFFPDGILALAGGLIFGFGWGSFYIIIGALCGGSISFFLARFYRKTMHRKLEHEKLIHFNTHAQLHGFHLVFLLRLVPLVPFNIISYSAGFSPISYRDFFFATLLGMLPGVLVYANIGAQTPAFGSQSFYIAIGLFVVLVAVSLALKKKVRQNVELCEGKEEN